MPTTPLVLSSFSRRPLCSSTEQMNELTSSFDHLQQRLHAQQMQFQEQREETHRSINVTFNRIFEQLIEIRRYCRNDIEQQALNTQIEIQQMLDAVQYMRTKSTLFRNDTSETYRSFSTELEKCAQRLSSLALSPARDLENLLSYLTASFALIPSPPHSTILEPMINTNNDSISSPTTTVDSGKTSIDSSLGTLTVNKLVDFKFGPTIALAFPCDMIASNGHSILSYVIERNFLNYATVSGSNLLSAKVYRLLAPTTVTNARIWDMTWCSWSKFYLVVTNLGLYSLSYPYDTNASTTEHSPQVNKLVCLRGISFQHIRLSSHSTGWFIYTVEHQNVSIDLYDRRSGRRLRHFDNRAHHDAIPLGFHGFCTNHTRLAIIKKTEVLSTINNPHQIENEQIMQVFFFDIESMICLQQMSLNHCQNVHDFKCCQEKNIFFILAQPRQLILINFDTNELLRKNLLNEGKHLSIINEHNVFILRSECSIQTLQYRSVKSE